MQNVKSKFGIRLKELRSKKQLSQEKLANIADLDRTYITQVENGKRNISIENIEKICIALDICISEFFNDDLFKR